MSLARRSSTMSLLLLLLVCASGCSLRAAHRERTALEDGLDRVDELIAARADRENLMEAMALLDTLALDSEDPRILARRARCDYALAYGFDPVAPDATSLYQAGRERAWRCIYRSPAFAGVLSATGGRISSAAVARIGPEQADCLLWLVACWSRWLLLEDPAVYGIDLAPLTLLADRAVELTTGDFKGQAWGQSALVRALTPLPLGPDLEDSEERFRLAILASPGDLSLTVDLAESVYAPLDDAARFRGCLSEILESAPEDDGLWALENQRARARARALLEADAARPARPR